MTPEFEATSATESVTADIVSAVAAAEGVDVTELEPLYDAIDPDALETLVGSGFVGCAAFTYHGYDVVVRGNGDVEVGEDVTLPVGSTP